MHQSTSLGDRIKAARGELNQEEFSQLLGVNRNTLRAYERGVNQPNAEFIALLSAKFYLNPAWILLGEGPMHAGERSGAPPSEATPAPAKATPSELDEIRQENRELRLENKELRQENRQLLKENGDLRVALVELKARTGPSEPSEGALRESA